MKKVIRRRSGSENKNEQGPFFKKEQEKEGFFSTSSGPRLPGSQSGDPSEKQADHMADQYIAGVQTQQEESTRIQNEEEKLQAQSRDDKRLEEEPVQKQPEEEPEENKVQSKTEKVSEEEKDKKVQAKSGNEPEKEEEVVQTQSENNAEEKEEEVLQSRGENEPEQEEDVIQSKEEGEDAPASVNNFSEKLAESKGKGSPMPPSLNEEMTSYFGTDFSSVRIHTGNLAARLCSQIGAQAFTHGNDIYFNQGKYKPYTSEGRHLLVHELTHVVQQGG